MGKHSASSPNTLRSLVAALRPRARSGRHSADQRSASGVLASVRSRPVLSAFVVPTAATAAVVASSLAIMPEQTDRGAQVVTAAPVVVENEAAEVTDETLEKAKEQAKAKPAEVSIEVRTEAPKPRTTSTAKASGDAKSGGSGGSGKAAGQDGSCPMSYYGGGDGFDGRKTANGETFDTNKLTAAHKTLPFGTKVKITNQANGKSVTVRINDRGPYHGDRCFDLSKAAMEAVGGVGAGQITGSYTIL
ncbi:rare lipoprotein A [Brevibacterium sanguinis]|uniref:Probable endolytic peptidoglycan transglycosylase RlpA n=2 Tax=Brevibacterium TaxID=1696 RepID=A0A366III5_9MICO|nr:MULTISPECIES: septal ring lytic transglycosylase RlpA family protein [Brevibacterium]RBP64715.1 rare lipoprotein A [Brevibacterium sanguinis]RBP71642.1 rare lipoprotein A [Brevibacterium celere]